MGREKFMKKNILLLPTTESVLNGWIEHYSLVENDFNIKIYFDTKLVKTDVKLSNYIFQRVGLGSLIDSDNILLKIAVIVVSRKLIRKVLLDIKPDLVVVSNDIAYPQSIFVQEAKKLNIKTVLHQHAGVMYHKTTPIEKSLKNIVKRILGMSITKVLGQSVNEVWIMGKRWEEYFINNNIKLLGSEFYKNFSKRTRRYEGNPKKYLLDKINSKCNDLICFYSQPLYENTLLRFEKVDLFYNDLYNIGRYLETKGIQFLVKAHPQENYIYKTKLKEFILDESNLDIWIDGADYSMSAYSQMLLQAKVNGNKTIGFMPDYIPLPQREQMIESMDYFINRTGEEDLNLLYASISSQVENKKNVDDIVNINLDGILIKEYIKNTGENR